MVVIVAHDEARQLFGLGIRDRPIAPRSPWQNGRIERLIGSIRRECVDHTIVPGEAHLRRIITAYADYNKAMAEGTVPRTLFADILRLIAEPRQPPNPAPA